MACFSHFETAPFLAQKEGFVSPHSTLVGPLGSKAALRPYSPPRGSNPSAPPNFLCKNKRGCLTKKRQLLFGAKKAFGL